MGSEVWLLALGAAAAGFVQGVSGFAFGMVAMSFWVWGIEPQVAAVMAVFGSLTGQLVSAATMRRAPDLPRLAPFLIGGVIGVPLGVAALPHLNPLHFKLVLGCILLLFCPAMLMAAQLPTLQRGGRLADGAVGMLAGVMGGIGGFTGIAPALWCTLRGMDKDSARHLLQNFNLAALSAAFIAMIVAGTVRREMLPLFAIVAPALVLPSLLGARVYIGLSPLAFRRLVLGLLSLSGLTMIAGSLTQLAHR